MSNIQARAPTEAVIPKYVQPKTILSLDVLSDLKVHLDPPPILVQFSQKLRDDRTKKSQNILFVKKVLIYEVFLGFWAFSISQP